MRRASIRRAIRAQGQRPRAMRDTGRIEMAEEEFEVHGPEHHAVEHSARSGDSLASRIAVMTAILSTVGAVFSYQGGATQNDAMMYKNEAVLKRTEASDQWAFYQAK